MSSSLFGPCTMYGSCTKITERVQSVAEQTAIYGFVVNFLVFYNGWEHTYSKTVFLGPLNAADRAELNAAGR